MGIDAQIISAIAITREDVARAKSFIFQSVCAKAVDVEALAEQWMTSNALREPKVLHGDAPDIADNIVSVARAYSVRLALYQAAWELIAVGELIHREPTRWTPNIDCQSQGYRGGLFSSHPGYPRPGMVERLPQSDQPTTDVDIFLKGFNFQSLHPGIRIAIEQALGCFRRSLYMPSVAMLAAAAEATWTECCEKVGVNLGDVKLQKTMKNPYASISAKVADIRKALATERGRELVTAAGQNVAALDDAELWTTSLRERRNSLHWSKSNSFIAEHSETANRLLSAPRCLATLEAIRLACSLPP